MEWKPSGRRLNQSEREVLAVLKRLGVPIIPSAVIERWEVDFLLPKQMAIVEVDGPMFHTGSDASRKDQSQDSRFRQLGLLPIHCWTTSLHQKGGRDKIIKHVVERLYHERGVVLPIRKDRSFARYYRKLGLRDY
jgi:very-short-patch-repair endonuclease